MMRSSSRYGRRYGRLSARRRFGVFVALLALAAGTGAGGQSAAAATASGGPQAPVMHGYAAGPAQISGTAAGKAHRAPASATRARSAIGPFGHPAPKPDYAPPVMGTPARTDTGSVRMTAGHVVVHGAPKARTSPNALSSQATGLGGGADNASYSVAATYDSPPMANQNGRIAVTLTNTGTSTWSDGYALGTHLFPSGDTGGTGTALKNGPPVSFATIVAPGSAVTVEGVTPSAQPGSYELCWDMINPGGVDFSAEGANEYCAPYTVQQYPPLVDEQEPLPGTDVDSQNPVLSAAAVVPGGYPSVPQFSFAFELISGPNPSSATVLQSSGWVANNGQTWSPPTALAWGGTYYWRVTVSDAATPPALTSTGITWTTPISFVVGDAQPQITSRLGDAYQADDGNPVMTSDLGGTDYTGSGRTVDPRTGNLSEQATDATVPTAGPALAVTRTYNSMDPRTTQAFGAAWSSVLDMSLAPDPDGSGALILTLADGQQIRFAKNAAGGYAPPQGYYAVLNTLSAGGFSVTDQTGTSYSFAQPSGASWLLSQIADEVGRAETFAYASGALTAVTNLTSGRALHLTWTTPAGAGSAHVATVSTDPVTAGQAATALTWTYGYSGDELTSVCPPVSATACTRYSYIANGSHASTSVLNANPTSYWRLNEPAGSSAAVDQLPVNDLTTVDPPATEMNTTPAPAGPIPGVSATAFNGNSSFIPLDGTWCPTPGQSSACIPVSDTGRVLSPGGAAQSLGIGVWFNTSTPSGVLLGLTSTLPAASNCSPTCVASIAQPLLWIGSNGHLQGAAGSTPLSSPNAVNDGKWHQAVLIPGQALYVDGAKVATATTGFAAPTGAYALLGAGLVPQNAFYSSWSFFNGSIADLSIYQNQLPTVGTVAAQYSAELHPSAELTTVTTPAGHTDLSAVYNPASDAVASLTDANAGTWTYGPAARRSSSSAYDNAVLGSTPQDFWPLADTGGPLAADLVGGAATAANPRPPASYSAVTLGVPGPTGFADGTAAGFTGSGSQISIPAGYFTGGAQSAELWFNTAKPGVTLLSSGASQSGGEPPALWIDATGCLNASVGSVQLGPALGLCTTAKSDDGTWHHAALTVGPVTTSSPAPGLGSGSGTSTQSVTLYLDGAAVNTVQASPFTLSSTGYSVTLGNGAHGDLVGSLADVSLYARQLTSTEVTGHFNALRNQVSIQIPGQPFQPPAYLSTPTLNTQTVTVTDPVGGRTVHTYANGAEMKTTDALGSTTYYGYDQAHRASTITDPDGDTTYVQYDLHNNVTATTTCATVGDCQTSYSAYYENPGNPLDPRNDKPTDARDARSSSPTDPTYDTVTTYTPTGLLASFTTPPTTACPTGCTTTHTYTAGSEPAVGGGNEPPGLVASVTTPKGAVTAYAYDSSGDLIQTTNPLGEVTKLSYDNLGRQLSTTQFSDTYPGGLTTGYSYDGLGRVLTQTNPAVTDRVTGAVHTEVTGYTYDPDSHVLTSTLSDATGGDPTRTTTHTYNAQGQQATTTDALGNQTSYTYDPLGDKVSVTDPTGQRTAYTYDPLGHQLTMALENYTGDPSNPSAPTSLVEDTRAYDPAGRLASDTNVKGTETAYTYYGDNQLASSYIVDPASSTGKAQQTSYVYDAAGNTVAQTRPGGLTTTAVINADGQLTAQSVDPAGVDRTTTLGYDADGNVINSSLTGGGATETESATYNAIDQQLTATVDNTGGNLTTTYTRDQRGLVTTETDPMGHTTTVQNDEAGRPVVEIDPAVPSQPGDGGAPVTAAPVTMIGYNTFGEQAETSDPNGDVTTAAYDQDGRQTSTTQPSYTAPGSTSPVNGTSTTTYDAAGRETSVTDPLGNTTRLTYDQLGDTVTQTDPSGGTWTYTYDSAGEQLSVTDPTGARSQATYDGLGRMSTSTQLIRQNTSAAYTTSFTYDDAGNETSETSPSGVKNTALYNAVGEPTSTTDGAGNTTTYTYNLDGALTKATAADGTAVATSYDAAGRQTSLSDLDANGAVLRTESAVLDADGHATSATDFQGDTASATYDPTGEQSSLTVPVSAGHSVTYRFGYDLNGNLTAQSDGNGNTTYATYNALGLPATTVEPSTSTNTGPAASTTTNSYDANGELVAQALPGGVRLAYGYDAMGNLTNESGSGAGAPTSARTFTYDNAGRMLTAATSAAGTSAAAGYQPATSESFGYDDRGLLLSASGTAGTSAFAYNASGQPTSVTDAAGTSNFGYDTAGRLATDTDAASGTTGTYSYNNLGQVSRISYGTGNDSQSFGYDALHRLASDTVATATGAQVASLAYTYNANNDVTSMTTSGLATPGGGSGTVTNDYGYDKADRLTSWTAAAAGAAATTKTYGYDDAGNLVNNNGTTYSYNARNELTSDGAHTYTYTANGDVLSESGLNGAVQNFSSDAYGQQITAAGSSYGYDALARLVTAATTSAGGTALTYDGATGQIASDGSAAYSRDPAGALVGVDVGALHTVALNDQHNDLSGLFTAAGTALTGSTSFDPWGGVLATTGPAVGIGYQGQWTDAATGQVNMGSRFYNPTTGAFLNRDVAPSAGSSTLNLHSYADDNPMSETDPTGHSPSADSGLPGKLITPTEVAAAKARANELIHKAELTSAAALATGAAAVREAKASSAAYAEANQLNSQAGRLSAQAAADGQKAQAAFNAAQRELAIAATWQKEAQTALAEAPYAVTTTKKMVCEIYPPAPAGPPVWTRVCTEQITTVDHSAYYRQLAQTDMNNYRAAMEVYGTDMNTYSTYHGQEVRLDAEASGLEAEARHYTSVARGDAVKAVILGAEAAGLAKEAKDEWLVALAAEAYYQALRELERLQNTHPPIPKPKPKPKPVPTPSPRPGPVAPRVPPPVSTGTKTTNKRCDPGVTYSSGGNEQQVIATLCPGEIGGGSPPNPAIKPPGWPTPKNPKSGKTYLYARCHLLGRQLGGSGGDPENLVTCYQVSVNLAMVPYENKIRKAVDAGQKIYFVAEALYRQRNSKPFEIWLFAYAGKQVIVTRCFRNDQHNNVC